MKPAIDIGIPEQDHLAITEGLSRLLADTYTLYLKAHNFHWNVMGPMFNTLRLMFKAQSTELATAVDEIAERTSIKEETGVTVAEEMIAQPVRDQEAVARTARSALPTADEVGDEPTANLLTQRMQFHEKTAWMLRSMIS